MKRADLLKHVGFPVRITWEDAVGDDSGWQPLDEALASELAIVTTVGLCVQVTHRAMYVVQDQHSSAVHGVGLIPIPWILSVEQLAPAVEIQKKERR